jgi:N-acetylglucosaminyldiphosphoundecaprenol N-acetyl-beta-D-mannosaminyltransferase
MRALTKPIGTVDILGIRIHQLTVQMFIQILEEIILAQGKALITSVNVHAINLACQHVWLRQFINESDFSFCDGAGVVLGARILGQHLPERFTSADWMWDLAARASEQNFTFYFLGARPGIAEKAALCLHERYPGLRILGIHHGYFDKTPGSLENEQVIQEINQQKPNILLVGFGMPLQERWLMENWDRIEANTAITLGAVFDYISGELKRAPDWFLNHNLEWLGRLLIEPRRLWRRYLIGNPVFIWRVMKQRLNLPSKDCKRV